MSLIDSSPAEVLTKEGGSARKYLLYAVGEIALVVIGILIALQINNWNEDRKLRLEEKDILVLMQKELQLCISTVERYIPIISSSIKTLDEVESLLTVGEIDSSKDFLTTLVISASFGRGHPGLPQTTFDELLNSGKLSLVRNTDLRLSIIDHYHRLHEEYDRVNDRVEFSKYFATIFRLIPREIKMGETGISENNIKNRLSPEDHERITKSIIESNLAQEIIPTRNRYELIQESWLVAKNRAQKLIDLIEIELSD